MPYLVRKGPKSYYSAIFQQLALNYFIAPYALKWEYVRFNHRVSMNYPYGKYSLTMPKEMNYEVIFSEYPDGYRDNAH